jgi:hypothetical protein
MGILQLRIFDGTRQPFPLPADFLVRVLDGNGKIVWNKDHFNNVINIPLNSEGGLASRFVINVAAKGYQQAGYAGFDLTGDDPVPLDIMLIAKDPGFSFVNAKWPAARALYPFLGSDTAENSARYDNLLDRESRTLACLLNVAEACSQIKLHGDATPLTFLKSLLWDGPHPPAQDRFFAWCDVELRTQVRNAGTAGNFSPEPNPQLFHPGATESWKENRFGEANVQITFHSNDVSPDDPDQIMVEFDIDYYANTVNHLLLEVLPNLFGPITDPLQVYVLRWIAGRQYGLPEFAPLYTVID